MGPLLSESKLDLIRAGPAEAREVPELWQKAAGSRKWDQATWALATAGNGHVNEVLPQCPSQTICSCVAEWQFSCRRVVQLCRVGEAAGEGLVRV